MSFMNVQPNKYQVIFRQLNARVEYHLAQLIERRYFYDC